MQSAGIICPSVSKNVVLYSLTASSHVIKHSPNEGLGKMDFILHKEPISCTAGQDQELLQVGSAVLEIRET